MILDEKMADFYFYSLPFSDRCCGRLIDFWFLSDLQADIKIQSAHIPVVNMGN